MSVLKAYIVPHPPIIVPEVGRGEEKKIQSTIDSFNKIASDIEKISPDTIVVISPHSTVYSDYIHISPGNEGAGDLGRFGAKGVRISKKYDVALADEISGMAIKAGIPAGTRGEREKTLDHGVLVPLYFVEKYYKEYELVRIAISGLGPLEHYGLGKIIASAASKLNRKTVIIASGDLSHTLKDDGPYGFSAAGPEFDRQVTQAMKDGDFLRFLTFDPDFCEEAAECGLRSFIIMAGALDGKDVKAEFLSYEGPFGVGYAVSSFSPSGESESRRLDEIYEEKRRAVIERAKSNEDEFVRLARLSLESYIKENRKLKRPEGLSEELLNKKAGVFVTIKKDGRLRGCIGTISPVTGSIADEIIRNAIQSGTEDPRFPPVSKEELGALVYSVDVLGEPEPIESLEELDVKNYGVIVSSGFRRGLLLPDLEGVDTPAKQVSIALQKAGIGPGEKYSMERFEVVRHR